MEFLQDLGKKIGKAAKVVEGKSKELVEISKLNIEIGKQEAEINKLYSRIGRVFYQAYTKNENLDDDIQKLCDEVSGRLAKIEELKAKEVIILCIK